MGKTKSDNLNTKLYCATCGTTLKYDTQIGDFQPVTHYLIKPCSVVQPVTHMVMISSSGIQLVIIAATKLSLMIPLVIQTLTEH